jgi:hypothetical protein
MHNPFKQMVFSIMKIIEQILKLTRMHFDAAFGLARSEHRCKCGDTLSPLLLLRSSGLVSLPLGRFASK